MYEGDTHRTSSSLVQMWVADSTEEIKPNLVPGNFLSGTSMRVVEPGTLAYLERAFQGRQRPRLNLWQNYGEVSDQSVSRELGGPFDSNFLVFEKIEGPPLGMEATLQLTGTLRNAAMSVLGEDQCPEWLTGHQPGGAPSLEPHAAFFPLPYIGAEHADGHIMGLGMALPDGITSAEAKRVLGPLLFEPGSGEERTIHLWRKGAWRWQLRRETRDRPPIALRQRTWTAPSRVWATVTPVVLHHHPKRNRERDVERILYEAFESAGLPRPLKISAEPQSSLKGALHARSIPAFSEGGDGLCRYQIHALVEFEDLVRGPVLVGRGRFRGYGLFCPVAVWKEPRHAGSST